MALAYKRLASGRGKLLVPDLIHTVGAGKSGIVKEINVVNRGGGFGPQAYFRGSNTSTNRNGLAWNRLAGELYVALGDCIYRVEASGKVSVLAGLQGSTGTSDGVGAAARFGAILDIVCDSAGTYLYVSDVSAGGTVRRVAISDGTVLTIAGQPATGTAVDNAVGTSGTLRGFFDPAAGVSIAISPDDSKLYLTSGEQGTIRVVETSSPYALSTVTFTDLPAYPVACVQASPSDAARIWLSVMTDVSPGTTTFHAAPASGGAAVQVATVSGTTSSSPAAQAIAHFSGITTAFFVGRNPFVVDESRAAEGIFTLYAANSDTSGPRAFNLFKQGSNWRSTEAFPVCGPGFALRGDEAIPSVGVFAEGQGGDCNMPPAVALVMANQTLLAMCVGLSQAAHYSLPVSVNGLLVANFFVTALDLEDFSLRRVAGQVAGTGNFAGTVGGTALVGADARFSLYVVPAAESLDRSKHCRFHSIPVAAGESWFADIAKNVEAGDKIYFEALSPGLSYELSGLEVS